MLKLAHKNRTGAKMNKKYIKGICTSALLASTLFMTTSAIASENAQEVTQEKAEAKYKEIRGIKFYNPSNIEIDEILLKRLAGRLKAIPEQFVLQKVTLANKIPVQDENVDGWARIYYKMQIMIVEQNKVISPVESVFVNEKNGLVAQALENYKTKKNYAISIKPPLPKDIYKNDSAHLIAGNKDAEHKIVIFSNPECPICHDLYRELMDKVRSEPNKFAVYYYGMSLASMPKGEFMTKVALYLKLNKSPYAEKVLDTIYSMDLGHGEPISDEWIKSAMSELTYKLDSKDLGIPSLEALEGEEIKKLMEEDQDIALNLGIEGTPTMFVDGEFDEMRSKFKEI